MLCKLTSRMYFNKDKISTHCTLHRCNIYLLFWLCSILQAPQGRESTRKFWHYSPVAPLQIYQYCIFRSPNVSWIFPQLWNWQLLMINTILSHFGWLCTSFHQMSHFRKEDRQFRNLRGIIIIITYLWICASFNIASRRYFNNCKFD